MNGYFDFNATTPTCSEALEVWSEIEKSHWHNPSSLYPDAAAANLRLEDAREQIADLLGCEPERLLFTSGATEANNAVFAHSARIHSEKSVVIGSAEHPSVADAAGWNFGDKVIEVRANESGIYDADHLRQILASEKVALVSMMAANNETGVLQPWREFRFICEGADIPFHCDAAQWLGKLEAGDLSACDFVTGSAHKFRGPKGVGFLVIPEDSPLRLQVGGPQEHGKRAGTENLASIMAMVAALESTLPRSIEAAESVSTARDEFERRMMEEIPGLLVAGKNAERLWNTSMVIVPEQNNLRWITRLGKLGFAASTGSACSAGKGKPSLALRSMGFDFEQMGRALRFSAGWDTSSEDWHSLAEAMLTTWNELKSGKRGGLSKPRWS